MGEVRNLYFDTWINAGNKLIEYVYEYSEAWDELPGYRKFGKLEYFRQLSRYIGIVEAGAQSGQLTKAQMRKYKALCRKANEAQLIIDRLQREYEESREDEDEEEE